MALLGLVGVVFPLLRAMAHRRGCPMSLTSGQTCLTVVWGVWKAMTWLKCVTICTLGGTSLLGCRWVTVEILLFGCFLVTSLRNVSLMVVFPYWVYFRECGRSLACGMCV